MSLSEKIKSSIINNLENDDNQIEKDLIDFLVKQAIRKGETKIESEIIPSFQVQLNAKT